MFFDSEFCGYCKYCICDNARDMIKNGKFKCDRENEWVFADSKPLKSNCFWQVPNYNLSGRDEAIKMSKKYRGFYIATMIYKMLNMSNSNELDELYRFKNNYLNANIDAFIKDYDIFAPKIARFIELSDKDNSFVSYLYNFYIKGVLNEIRVGNLIGAKELYEAMYSNLREKFITGPLKKSMVK